jgi:uncharacterized membrane protein YdbT with pleckstrin-like domain
MVILDSDERVVYETRPSWLLYLDLFVPACGLWSLFAYAGHDEEGLVVILLAISYAAVSRLRQFYLVTSKRVVMRHGLIARQLREMEARHIRGINIRQGILARMLDIGTIDLVSAADGRAEVTILGVRHPVQVKEIIRGIRK